MATYFFIISFERTFKIICKSPLSILRNFIISWGILTEKITNQRAFWRIGMLRQKQGRASILSREQLVIMSPKSYFSNYFK
jgi:hypothetical protein